jgi:hypothetical protein
MYIAIISLLLQPPPKTDYTETIHVKNKLAEIFRLKYAVLLHEFKTGNAQERKKASSGIAALNAKPSKVAAENKITFSSSPGEIGTIPDYAFRVVKVVKRGEVIMMFRGGPFYFHVKGVATDDMPAGEDRRIQLPLVYMGTTSIDGYDDIRSYSTLPTDALTEFDIDIKKIADASDAEMAKQLAESKSVKNEKDKVEYEVKAAELLKHAKRWQSEGNKEIAVQRLEELLRRFPKSKVAGEAKKMLEGLK